MTEAVALMMRTEGSQEVLVVTMTLAAACLSTLPAVAQGDAGPGASDPTGLAREIDALVRPQAEAGLVSGVILVARGGRPVFEHAYGFASWELKAPSQPSTRFGIASITKVMTQVLVDRLVREGSIDLDAPVEHYLPGFPRGPEGGAPTVRQLVEHRAGVPHRVTTAADETHELHPADIVRRVRDAGLLFEPGSRRLYSSAGYTCLARVIEVVTGRPFDEVLASRVSEPAGMVSTVDETGESLMSRRALPYRLGASGNRVVVKAAPYEDLHFLTGAGSVFATARDLLRFVEAIRSGVFGRRVRGEAFGPDSTSWSGWYGRTNGYEASVDVLRAGDLVFIFLANLQSAANWQIRNGIRQLLLGDSVAAIPMPPPVVEPFEDLASLVGSYGPAEITVVDGKPFRGDNEFYPTTGGRYYIPGSGSSMRFRRDADDEVDAMISISPGGKETVLRKAGR